FRGLVFLFEGRFFAEQFLVAVLESSHLGIAAFERNQQLGRPERVLALGRVVARFRVAVHAEYVMVQAIVVLVGQLRIGFAELLQFVHVAFPGVGGLGELLLIFQQRSLFLSSFQAAFAGVGL